MQRGSSCAGEFTQVEIGTASSSSAFGAARSSADGSPGESQASKSSGSRMSSMRSWIGCTSSLAAVVMMVKVSIGCLEVAQCSAADWQRAILQGFVVWREVVRHAGGRIVVDLDERRISYAGLAVEAPAPPE